MLFKRTLVRDPGHVSRRWRRLVAPLLALALLFSLAPTTPAVDAQGNQLYSESEQQDASRKLILELAETTGPVDFSTIVIDPALGPPPWISFTPDRDPSTIAAWTELARRVEQTSAKQWAATVFDESPSALGLSQVEAQDIEAFGEIGLNDTPETGQLIEGFGTGSGDEPLARITGSLSGNAPPPAPPNPPILLDCPSEEEDGSITDANPTPVDNDGFVAALCGGFIGDGEFGETSGDVDFFALNQVPAGNQIILDAFSPDDSDFSVALGLYDADGNLVASHNDDSFDLDDLLFFEVEEAGTYFAAVAGVDALPSDPFDPSSGTGVTYVGDFFTFVVNQPPPVFDCESVEEDGSIEDANQLPGAGQGLVDALCGVVIGDGEFGASSGDIDFYDMGELAQDTLVILDAVEFDPNSDFELSLGLYRSDGTLVASVDDVAGTFEFLELVVEETDNYFAAIAGVGSLPTDPFDPGSGQGVTYTSEDPVPVVLLGLPLDDGGPIPVPPPPFGYARNLLEERAAEYLTAMEGLCTSVEDDGAIPIANPVDVAFGESTVCEAAIGDGPFGETSGDFDYYTLNADAGDFVTASIEAAAVGSELDSFLVVFDDNGQAVAFNDDFNGLDSQVGFQALATGTYHVAVASSGSLPEDPFDPGSGPGVVTTGPYSLTLSRTEPPVPDVDVYLVDLEAGDAISGGFRGLGYATIVDPTGRLGQGSLGSATFIYPLANPLRHFGDIGIDFVAEFSGIHAIGLESGGGFYEGELRVKRGGAADQPGDDAQILFLDFDGGSFNDAIYQPGANPNEGTERTLSPLVDWLPRWGLDAGDEDAVIEAIVAEVTDDLLHDLSGSGLNGNRDATGNGGELDLQILNSRDHDDPWGQPNVSRIIVGGSIEEAGIQTIGIAQSIDPGNFETEETAIVLLDVLSAPVGEFDATLNRFEIEAPSTKIDLVGRGVGNITAHEAGHFIGNWHTDSTNDLDSIMDEGRNIAGTIGVGPDGVFGSADDGDVDLVTDGYSLFEGFFGVENTTVRSAFAFSTGQAGVTPFDALPEDGRYVLQNVRSGRYLDADFNGDVNTSGVVRADDVWELINIGGDIFNVRNERFDTYLDGDADGTVDQSDSARNDDRWQLIPTNAGSFLLFNTARDMYLTQVGTDVRLTDDTDSATRWYPLAQ